MKIQNKKFFVNEDENVQDIDNEDNDIIINENDDSISQINYCEQDNITNTKKVKDNSIKKTQNDKNNIIEEKPIINHTSENQKSNKELNNYTKDENFDINSDKNLEINLSRKNNYTNNEEINNKNDIDDNIKKNGINSQKVGKRLLKKTHTFNNDISLTFSDINSKKDICTCLLI